MPLQREVARTLRVSAWHYKSSLSNEKRWSSARAGSEKEMDNTLFLVTCLGPMHFVRAGDRDDWLDLRTIIPLTTEWQRLVHKQHVTKRYPIGKHKDFSKKNQLNECRYTVFFLRGWVSLYSVHSTLVLSIDRIHTGYVYMQPNNQFVIGLTAQSDWKALM